MVDSVEINVDAPLVSHAILKRVDVLRNVRQDEKDIVALNIVIHLLMAKTVNQNVFAERMQSTAMCVMANVNVNQDGLAPNVIKNVQGGNMVITVQINVYVQMENVLMIQEGLKIFTIYS